LYYLDIVDHFIVNYGLVIVGILEALIVGWFWKGDQLLEFINESSKWKFGMGWKFSIKVIIPVFLTGLLILNLIEEFKNPYGGYPGWALLYIGILPIVLAPFIGAILDKLTSGSKDI
jgi:neurotransmitter:Na+ symporter, NSS family